MNNNDVRPLNQAKTVHNNNVSMVLDISSNGETKPLARNVCAIRLGGK